MLSLVIACLFVTGFGLGIAAYIICAETQEIERLRQERIEVERGRLW